jgi:hypothetical protein
MNYIDANEKQIIAEALNRGATVGFLTSWLRSRRPAPPPSREAIRQMILPELTTYLNKVTAEFQSLTKLGFKDPDGRVEPLKHYWRRRSTRFELRRNA